MLSVIYRLFFILSCGLNIVLYRAKVNVSVIYGIFASEAMILLAFFFVSGIPDGFSALWICLIPSFALLIFGRKDGGIFCLIALMGGAAAILAGAVSPGGHDRYRQQRTKQEVFDTLN